MRCASYARYVSCVPEKNIPSDIIRQQNDRIQKYIKQHGWELVRKYADRKQDTEAENAFCTMRNDGISRKFDMVVVDSLLRCGPNVSYAEDVLLKSFLPAGIHFAVPKNYTPVMKSDNAFIKQIFDKTTGVTVVCKLHRIKKPYQTFGISFWQKKTIRYDYVMEQTVKYLRSEQRKIERAKEWIASDVGQHEKQRRKAVFAKQARTLFEEMAELEKVHLHYYCMSESGDITEEKYRRYREQINAELAEKEAVFKNLMVQVDELELAFSNRNPWMVFYGNIKIPDKLTKEEVRKWIDKVLIENMETVEVVLPAKHTRWRDILPIQETEVR